MSDLLNLYNLSESSDGLTYQFETESGVIYTAYFICMDCYTSAFCDTYSFSFDRNSSIKPLYDYKIQHTICHILNRFFSTNVNSVIYVCDSTDGRELARSRLFDKWHKCYNEILVERYCTNLDTADYNLYASLFILPSNPNKEAVIQSFNDLPSTYYVDGK